MYISPGFELLRQAMRGLGRDQSHGMDSAETIIDGSPPVPDMVDVGDGWMMPVDDDGSSAAPPTPSTTTTTANACSSACSSTSKGKSTGKGESQRGSIQGASMGTAYHDQDCVLATRHQTSKSNVCQNPLLVLMRMSSRRSWMLASRTSMIRPGVAMMKAISSKLPNIG